MHFVWRGRDDANGVRVVERYVAGPSGLEQTFDIGRKLPGSGSLRVDVAFAGLAPVADAAHHRLRLVDARGRQRAVYGELAAYDANGRDLPAHMELHGRVATLVIDDRKAAYPVEIDPLIAVEQAKLHAGDGAAMDFFGTGAALSGGGDTAVVGAPERKVGANTLQGAAYVFVRSGSSWTQQAELVASDGAANDHFGGEVSASGDGNTVLVGAAAALGGQGAVYVFVRSGSTWTLQTKLVASGSSGFGNSVSLSQTGDAAVIGDEAGGTAYVFKRSGTSWDQGAKLEPGDLIEAYGSSVAVSPGGDTAVVGAPYASQ